MNISDIIDYFKYNKSNDIYNDLIEAMPSIKNRISLVFQMEYNINPLKLIEGRNYQSSLRQYVLNKYKSCIIDNNITSSVRLDCAHIKPVTDCNEYEKRDTDNILLLWTDLHRCFDRYKLTINPNTCKVEVNTDNEEYLFIKQYNGIHVKELSEGNLRYLQYHYNQYVKHNNINTNNKPSTTPIKINKKHSKYNKNIRRLFINSIKDDIRNELTRDDIHNIYNNDNYHDIALLIYDKLINKTVFKYRYGQKKAYNNFKYVINNCNTYWGLLIAPTGWGKSLIHLLMINTYWNKYNKNVILVTKRKDIINDQVNSLPNTIQLLRHNKIIDNNINIINQLDNLNYNTINDLQYDNNLIMINIDKLINKKTKYNEDNYDVYEIVKSIKWDNIGMVIFDEVHWAGASMTYQIMKYIKDIGIDYCIGSSATPIRSNVDNQKNIEELFPRLNILDQSQNYTLEVLYELSYEDAWNNDVILPVNHEYFQVDDYTVDVGEGGRKRYTFQDEGRQYIIDKLISYHKTKSAYGKFILYSENKESAIRWYHTISNNEYFNCCTKYISFSNLDTNNKSLIDNLNMNDMITSNKIKTGIDDFKKESTNSLLFVVFQATEGFNDERVDVICNLDFVMNPCILLLIQKQGRAQRKYLNKKYGYYLSPIPNLDQEEDDMINYFGNLFYDYVNAVLNTNKISDSGPNGQLVLEYIDKYITIDDTINICHLIHFR
jgi:superfamily II DNA or RNA helicase